MFKTLYYDFGNITVFSKFVIVVMNEGVNVIPEYNDALVKLADKYFQNRYFGYITYRRNSYSVNPLVYIETSKIDKLVGIAVVCPKDGLTLENAKLEKQFVSKPFDEFISLDEAKNWILELLTKKESENQKE